MGFAVPVEELGHFTYRAVDPESGLVEHEYDHVFVGWFDGAPKPDPSEVSDWTWTALANLKLDLARDPDRFTPWLGKALEALRDQTVRRASRPRPGDETP
jgi:isopentenyl-diphosphate delta-isomerase